ncbi:methyltransferase domain-containing protein [Actinocatenispora sera]|uniref:Ubiquinone biosynthesis O-methyltransferase n=1 Tax=Actinocatenispora sera TaxID=390989 RepID=A0A810KZ92_9ACTN|nr:methyltransferase domain-containing protein [Actinocatenispora sera]BCJ27779.1 ubiquinone biosynthesis O-methyltransferase [Actinocatenispora sera]
MVRTVDRAPGRHRGRNELSQYERLRDEWWRPGGVFASLSWLAEARARLVPPAPRPGAVLVDLGCGGGLLAPWLAGRGYRHVGVDPVATSLRVAREHGVTPLAGDAYRVPLASGCADVVVAGELLEHVADPARVIAEAARLLRPGGLLVGDTINATMVARLILVTLGERIPGVVLPRGPGGRLRFRPVIAAGIHDPDLFVPPGLLRTAARAHGVDLQVRGLRPGVPGLLRFVATGRGPVTMRAGGSSALLYQFRGRRRGRPPGETP